MLPTSGNSIHKTAVLKGVCMDTNKILKDNEIEANQLMTKIILVTIGIVAITWLLFETGFFYIRVQFRGLMIFNILLLATVAVISRIYKYEKGWIKYILMGSMTIVFAVTTSALTYNVTLLIVIPILMSIRYFNRKYTVFIAILSIIVFYIAYLYGANHGMLDMNFVQYTPGTVIVTNDNMWLDDAVMDIPYDPVLMLFNTTVSNYFVKLLQFIIISAASLALVVCCQGLLQKQKELTESTARIGAELELAEKIQSDMLPTIFPTFSGQKEFDIYASITTAREVGGDFYDFFMIDDDHLAIIIADVSGKGIPAAMFMMTAKTTIKDYALTNNSTSEIYTIVNDRLCENNEAEMFATSWIGILNIRTMIMQYTNAGHNYPVLMRKGKPCEFLTDKHGLFLAGLEGTQYTQSEIQLASGDRLLLYTDGVTEAHSKDNAIYGEDRLKKLINDTADEPGETVLSRILDDVNRFADGADQFDDITMTFLIIKDF